MPDVEQEKNGSNTSDELRSLKKKLANDIVNKIQENNPTLAPVFLEETINNYLLNEKSFKDNVADLGRKIILNTAKLNFLEQYRDMISNAKTAADLEGLKVRIFNDIEQKYHGSSTSQESNNASSSNGSAGGEQAKQGQNESQGNAQQSSSSNPTSQSSTELAKVSGTESYEIDHFNITVSAETKKLWEDLKGEEKPDLEPFACGVKFYNELKSKGELKSPHDTYITIVDFSKKRGKNRCFVVNMNTKTVEYAVKVGHGKNSGGEIATSFSNTSGSNKSSLGGYIINEDLEGSSKGWKGHRMKGKEKKINDSAARRAIFMHPGGEIGSLGCFTLPKNIASEIMNKVKGGALFAYAKSEDYFAQSEYFQKNSDGSYAA